MAYALTHSASFLGEVCQAREKWQAIIRAKSYYQIRSHDELHYLENQARKEKKLTQGAIESERQIWLD